MDKTTQSHSTVISWTDFQNLSENMTDTISVDIIEPSSFHLKRLILTALFVMLIILANIISLVAFFKEKRLRTYNNYFIINLTILDLLIGVGLIPNILHAYLGHYPFSQTACKILAGVVYGIINASNLSVVAICADRHQALYDPINHFISRSKRKAVIINSLPWVIGLSFWIGYITVWEFVVGFDNGDQCIHQFTVSPLMNIIQKVAVFFLPLVIIAVLYFRIFIKIRRSIGGKIVDKKFDSMDGDLTSTVKTSTAPDSDSSVSHPCTAGDTCKTGHGDAAVVPSLSDETTIRTSGKKSSVQQRLESTSETKKATRTLLLIVVAFVTAWIGESIISLIYSIAPRLIVPGLSVEVYVFFSLMPFANSLLNPISYAMSQPLFRATVISMFSCKRT